MALIGTDEARRRVLAGQTANLFLVSGIVANGADGPERWAQWFEGLELTIDFDRPARPIEDEARLWMWRQMRDGRHGVLLIANVFQMINGFPEQVDTYAVYADDPDRPGGQFDPNRRWQPPPGFEGTESRMPFPTLPLPDQVFQ